MSDEARKLLKLFGVSVTDFEAEADRLATGAADRLASATREEAIALLKDTAELCRDLNQKWLEVTQHAFAAQDRLLAAIAAAAKPRA